MARTTTGWAAIIAAVLCCSVSAVGPGEMELRRSPVVRAYERVRDSVVNISALEKVSVERWGVDIFGDAFLTPQQRDARSVGSGAVIHEDGYIATNAHVVSAGAQLSVTFADGSEHEARVIGRDASRDLAVIKIDAGKPLRPIPLGRSDDLMIGEQVLAVGNPVGLQNTVTTGVISALHRELEFGGRAVYRDVIQTDASINPGNSGGPLLNILGEMIGINTAIRGDAQNIGFAIPVDQLRELLPDILDSEKINRVQVGMRVGGFQPARVLEVRAESPAARAGVQLGDVVLRLDGRAVLHGVDFYVAMLARRAGDVLPLALERDGKPLNVELRLDAVPRPDGAKLAQEKLGMAIAEASGDVARRFRGRKQGGVIVMAVEPDSPAAQAGLLPGDFLSQIGRYSITDVDQVGTLLRLAKTGDPIDIVFRRENRRGLFEWETRVYAR